MSFVRVALAVVCLGLAVATTTTVTTGVGAQPGAAAPLPGERRELVDRRTETSRVFANPSGTVTLEQHNQPIHVRRGAGWVPVDDTLEARDGRIVPRASPLAVSFSAGGDAPLATWTSGAASLSLSWPTSLPAPVLDGDTAEYSEVLPGVDLRAQADVAGARLLVVVKNREMEERGDVHSGRRSNVPVLDNSNGTSSVVVRDLSNRSRTPTSVIPDMTNAAIQRKLDRGYWE
ncbi:MAG TPA: hypothetical protein VGD67_23790 [Pseudonocardiaceae bacterium]